MMEVVHHISTARRQKKHKQGRLKPEELKKGPKAMNGGAVKVQTTKSAVDDDPKANGCPEPGAPEFAFEPLELNVQNGGGMNAPYSPNPPPTFSDGPWSLVLSAQALKDLQQAQREGRFATIRRVIEELATGDWSRRGLTKPHKADGIVAASNVGMQASPGGKYTSTKSEIESIDDEQQWQIEEWAANGIEQKVLKLYKAVYGKNHRILWGVEGAWDEALGGWRQVIKIWRIGDHKEILEVIPAILRAHRTYSPEYVKACKLRNAEPGTQRYLPARFTLSRQTHTVCPGPTGRQRPPPAERRLTPEENLGLHEATMTNKFYTLTSTLVNSMLAAHAVGVQPEFAFDVNEQETSIIRQNGSVLVLGRSGTGKTTCLVYKLLAGYLARKECNIVSRQMFLTRSPILADKIRLYLKRLIESQLCQFENALVESANGSSSLVEREERWGRDNLRDLFALKETDWPLVATFDELCGLLEQTLQISHRHTPNPSPISGNEFCLSQVDRRVDFDKFKRVYWPRFPPSLRKGNCVDLVFGELMGIIKSGTYETNFRPLTREQYGSVSCRLAPSFQGEAERQKVYDIYELYQARLFQQGEFDELDRCRAIRESLAQNRELAERIRQVLSEVYVDEVQDLTHSQLGLLLELVLNPRGLHLAGDTAQSISRDSTFRFQDVKALFWKFFQGMAFKGGCADLAKPCFHTLTINYRSHQGILSFASSVVDILWKHFPDTVDKLQPEVGQFVGPKPKLFVGFSSELFGNRLYGIVNIAEELSDFGAEQVILVRDDEARDELRKSVGEVTLILTILESKGMEFEDVLLYNYFAKSGNALSAFRALVAGEFEPRKHAVLCTELKGLYVAITRPRSRLWLIEENEDSVAPIIKLWSGNGFGDALLDVVTPDNPNLKEIVLELRQGNSTSSEAWYGKGVEFVEKRLWHPALQCFEKAGDEKGKNLAKAHLTEIKALDMMAQPDVAKALFRTAAGLFLAAEHPRQASKCYVNIKDFAAAATIWTKRGEHSRAAELWARGGYTKEAADQYHLAGQLNDAARAYREGDHFELLLEYLTQHGPALDGSVFKRYSRLLNVLFRKPKDGVSVSKYLQLLAIDLLGSPAEKERFLKQYDMHEDLLAHYDTTGEIQKAASHYANAGEYAAVARLLRERGTPDNVSAEFADEIFRWMQTEHLYDVIQKIVSSEDLKRKKKEELLLDMGEFTGDNVVSEATQTKWQILRKELTGLFVHFDTLSPVANPTKHWNDRDTRLTADLLIVSHGAFFGEHYQPREFPFQSVSRCADAIKLAMKDGMLPDALRRFYRISLIEDSADLVWILKPSPLLRGGENRKESKEMAVKMVAQTLSDTLANTVYLLETKSWDLLKSTAMCEDYAARGMCKYQEECWSSNGHYRLSRCVALSRIELLNSSTELVMSLKFSYINRLFQEERHAIGFRGTVRKWLEELLRTTTFTSEYLTHPLVCTSLLYGSGSDSERPIKNEIEELMYYRLKVEARRWNFSGLLEAIDLAESLNVTGLSSMVRHRIHWNELAEEQWMSFSGLLNVFELQASVVSRDICSALDYIWQIFPMIVELRFDELSFMHSVITFWEKYCCFLIVLASPTEFLIKDSWRAVYLKNFLDLFSTYECFTTIRRDEIKEQAKATLDMVVGTMLGILKRLEFENASLTLKSLLQKRPDVLVRRIVDLLAICLCNMQEPVGLHFASTASCAKAGPISEAWNTWRKYLKLPVADTDVSRFMVVFAQAYLESYQVDIDSLTLLQKTSVKLSRFRLMKPSWAVRRTSFPNFRDFDRKLVTKRNQSHPQLTSEEALAPAAMAHSKDVETAARKIQAFWRKYQPLLDQRRAFRKTPEGRARAKIEDICVQLKNPINESMEMRQLRLVVLRKGGVPAELALIKAAGQITALKSYAKRQLNDENIESQQIEELDEGLQELEEMERELTILKSNISFGRKIVECDHKSLELFLRESKLGAGELSKKAVALGTDLGFPGKPPVIA